jgi:NAD(P)H-dependent flavin oxidoreductase YrpB (nitropropane dioxygenase family)
VVERLHEAGIMVMNMVGSPKHVTKALECGVDAVCAQGTEAGGHTGDVATTVLIPQVCMCACLSVARALSRRLVRTWLMAMLVVVSHQCVDICKGRTSPLTGGPIAVVGAGGIYDGRGMAAALALGATAVWIGTRFVAAEEAAVGPRHQKAVVNTSSDDTVRTTIFSGRPMRVMKNDYIMEWETKRQNERDDLLAEGKRPYKTDLTANEEAGTPLDFLETYPNILGQASGGISEVLSAETIVHDMVSGAFDVFRVQSELLAEASEAELGNPQLAKL